jgi:adenylate cyclase
MDSPINIETDQVQSRPSLLTAIIVVALLAGLPLSVWLDLRNLSETALRRQSEDVTALITAMRGYYATNVVGRILAAPGHVDIVHNYETIPGAIPIPATLSLELGKLISAQQSSIAYRFVSDLPFKNRAPHALDQFELKAIAELRRNPAQELTDVSWSGLENRYRLIAPVVMMSAACVACHNTHPDSPKTDWKTGDVRGIQEVTITRPVAQSLFSFKYLLTYFVLAAAAGIGFVMTQRSQAAVIARANRRLEALNQFQSDVAQKISRYLAPQIFSRIFSGARDVKLQTERKKLTIFFSDIKDFTSTTEQLQPEEITTLLNEYLTEMSVIATKHGGTIDKFVGDAMLVFFGDPETQGTAEDAKACLRMAIEMQHRLAELNIAWRGRGVEHPFRARMGINTGFCNVGNFGSADRMDYTIIGAEVNLTARLQSIAEPGSVVVSYETYAQVRDIATARMLSPISVKGISHPVTPYVIEGLIDASGREGLIVSESDVGVDIYLDLGMMDAKTAERVHGILAEAMGVLENRK